MGVDPAVILASSHGRRSIDVLRLYDPARANLDCECPCACSAIDALILSPDVLEMEGRIPREFGNEAEEIPGARKLLDSLNDRDVPWAVVTSGTKPLVNGWLEVLKLAHPKVMVTAESVDNGKPDPACYLLGRSSLGLDAETDLIVFEDAPAGIKAGKAAGFRVVGLTTSHPLEQVVAAGADWIVQDLTKVTLVAFDNGKISITIKDSAIL